MDKATFAGIILLGVAMVWMVALVIIDRILTPKKKRTVHGSKPIDGKRKITRTVCTKEEKMSNDFFFDRAEREYENQMPEEDSTFGKDYKKMKYKATVTQIFDTYPEWTKELGTVNTKKEADQLITDARKKYYSRILVSYDFNIEKL